MVAEPPPRTNTSVDKPDTPISPIDNLLREAAEAFAGKRLTTPYYESAHYLYLRVLEIEPANQRATLGINNIVEEYLSWALAQAEAGNYRRARQYVKRAQSVDVRHPNIPPTLTRIMEAEAAVVTEFKINRDALRHRTVSKLVLRRIAERIQPGTFVTIRAPDDASGRWLYQELNQRVDFRVEATFEMHSQPGVSLSR